MFWLFWLSLAVAKAPSILGPDGTVWFGPYTPQQKPWQEVVVVDPLKGSLYVEIPQTFQGRRYWVDNQWKDLEKPLETDEVSANKLLRVSIDANGVKRRFEYNEQGLLLGIFRADGSRVQIRYNQAGQVVRIEGPYSELWQFNWGAELEVRGPQGVFYRVLRKSNGNTQTITIRDRTGRSVQMQYKDGKLHQWIDPRGFRTQLTWRANGVQVRDSHGKQWRYDWDKKGQLVAFVLPNGAQWKWRHDESGVLREIIDPVGRKRLVTTNEEGMPNSITNGAYKMRIHRDERGWITGYSDTIGRLANLKRNQAGQLVEIQDAVGSTIQFKRKNGEIVEIRERDGGQWVLERNRYGTLLRITSPLGNVHSFHRNLRQQVIRLQGSRSIAFERDSHGNVSQLKTPLERNYQIGRDAFGRIQSIQRPNGVRTLIKRDVLGEIIEVVVGEKRWQLTRDVQGRITALNNHRFTRDVNGLLHEIKEEGRSPFLLRRDASGLIYEIQRDDYLLRVRYDDRGLPVLWEENGGPKIQVVRNSRGQKVVDEKMKIVRDTRGLISQAQVQGKRWKWLRGPAGRILQVVAPGNLKLGIERVKGGRIVRIRYPDSSFVHYRFTKDVTESTWVGENGTVVDKQRFTWDSSGLLQKILDSLGVTNYRRNPFGGLVAKDRKGQQQWSRSGDQETYSNGNLVYLDRNNRPMAAQVKLAPGPWGVGEGHVVYQYDKQGRLSSYIAEDKQGNLYYDGLDRLTTYCTDDEKCWRLNYDPRGFLRSYTTPAGEEVALQWLREHSLDMKLLTSGSTTWIDGPLGLMAALRDGARMLYFHDLRRRIRWTRWKKYDVEPQFSSMGLSYQGLVEEVFGTSQQLHLFSGGPILMRDVAFDPLGVRLDGRGKQMIQHSDLTKRVGDNIASFAPTSVWHHPNRILKNVKGIPDFGTNWAQLIAFECPVHWLTDDRGQLEIPGPGINHIPRQDGDLEWGYLLTVLNGRIDRSPAIQFESLVTAEIGEIAPFEGALGNNFLWQKQTKAHPNLAELPIME